MVHACPYLALADDDRTAIAAYDPEHRCGAVDPPESVERGQQQQLCLTDDHVRCERYVAAEGRFQRDAAKSPRPAPDAVLVSTRMVLEPDPSWRGLNGPGFVAGSGARRLLIGGAAAVVGLAGVAGAVTGTFDPLFASGGVSAAATPSPTPAVTAAPTLAATPIPTAQPTPVPTPVPTVEPTAQPTPAPTAEPTVRTYRVQSGDTLSSIAGRFSVSVQAIINANGLTSDVINIGQVLVIP